MNDAPSFFAPMKRVYLTPINQSMDTVLKKCVSSIFSILNCITINIQKNETYTVANFGNCQ